MMENCKTEGPKRETQVARELGRLREVVDVLEKTVSELGTRLLNVRDIKGTLKQKEGGEPTGTGDAPLAPLANEIKEVYKKINGQISNLASILRELEV